MTNKEIYTAAWDNCHAPEELKKVVKNREFTKRSNVSYLKVASMGLVLAASLFAGSNGICYAATGNTWVEKITFANTNQTVELNMHEIGDMVYTDYVDENGNSYYRGNETDDEEIMNKIAEDAGVESVGCLAFRNSMSQAAQKALDGTSVFSDLRDQDEETKQYQEESDIRFIPFGLIEEDGKIYYIVGDEVKIDVTKGMKKGKVYEEYTFEGKEYKVNIEGSIDDYVMHASFLEE